MFISEDGTVTGSVDVSRLGEVQPKTDEARAQHEAVTRDLEQGQRQAEVDAARASQGERALGINSTGRDDGGDGSNGGDGGGVQQPAGGDGSNGGEGSSGGGRTTQAQPSAADGDGDSSGGGAPAQAEPKAAWVDYAVSQGVSREEAEASSKSDLVGRFGSGR